MPLGILALLATALAAATAGAATPSAGPPRARPEGPPIVLALTATHPTSAALGSLSAHLSSIGMLSPAWLELQPAGRFAYNAEDAFTAGLTQRGARLVPVLADPQHLAGELLANGPVRRRLAVRLSVALHALGARGVVLDWRDLAPQARAQYPVFVHELRVELGPAAQIVVTVPPVRTLVALKTGAYDLRALARPARVLVLAWNEHGPRSEPGPVASLAFWKRTLRTVLRAAPRSRVLMGVPTWGWRWSAGAGAEQATQAELFPEATQVALSRPYGARVGTRAWVESDRSVQLKLLTAREARIGGVALWVRGGESSATWRQPLLAPPGGGLSR
ncbi:MAG TPA: glycosyl hydrolase family 18 protein [Gaiellales bacterium]|nr:glycosyl hydrolase family 18 protein [Gaiellales bacterium]